MCRQGLGMEVFLFLYFERGVCVWGGGGAMELPLFVNGIYVTLNVDNRVLLLKSRGDFSSKHSHDSACK